MLCDKHKHYFSLCITGNQEQLCVLNNMYVLPKQAAEVTEGNCSSTLSPTGLLPCNRQVQKKKNI